MKFTLIILSLVFPIFAGAAGGGGLRPGMGFAPEGPCEPTIILGAQADSINYATAKLFQGRWLIQFIRNGNTMLWSQTMSENAFSQMVQTMSWTVVTPPRCNPPVFDI